MSTPSEIQCEGYYFYTNYDGYLESTVERILRYLSVHGYDTFKDEVRSLHEKEIDILTRYFNEKSLVDKKYNKVNKSTYTRTSTGGQIVFTVNKNTIMCYEHAGYDIYDVEFTRNTSGRSQPLGVISSHNLLHSLQKNISAFSFSIDPAGETIIKILWDKMYFVRRSNIEFVFSDNF